MMDGDVEDDGKRVQKSAGMHIVSPGDVISADAGYLRGHGTFVEDGELLASIAGLSLLSQSGMCSPGLSPVPPGCQI